jgi:hypothetical protein
MQSKPNNHRLEMKVTPQETKKTSAQGQSYGLQPANNKLQLDSAMSFTESNSPLSSHVPGQPLRMVLKRLHSDNWNSRLVTVASSQSTEKKTLLTPASQSRDAWGSLLPCPTECPLWGSISLLFWREWCGVRHLLKGKIQPPVSGDL